MEYLKWTIVIFLILGFINSGHCKPSTPATNEDDNYADDYPQADDDYTYDDDEDVTPPKEQDINETILDDPYFEIPNIEQIEYAGNNVTLFCDVKNLRPVNIIMWSNGSQFISQSTHALTDRVVVQSDNAIKLLNVQSYDSNNYTCRVLPQSILHTVNLKIIHPVTPKVQILYGGKEVTERSITFEEGQRVEFECRASGLKNPVIKWSLRGKRVGNNETHVENGLIVIKSIEHHHYGVYQCIGDSGESHPPHASVTVNVKYRPKISTHRHYVNADLGENAELDCTFHSDPEAIVTWKISGKLLKSSSKHLITTTQNDRHGRTTLIVKKVENDDYGLYECIAENTLGKHIAEVHLIREPEIAQFENSEIVGSKVALNWLIRSRQPLVEAMLDYQNNGTQTWMTETPVSQKHNEHTGIWKIRHELELGEGTWIARVKTKNTAGWSKFSNEHAFVVSQADDNSNSIPEDTVFVADMGGSRKTSSASRQLLMSTTFVISLIVSISLVPSLIRL